MFSKDHKLSPEARRKKILDIMRKDMNFFLEMFFPVKYNTVLRPGGVISKEIAGGWELRPWQVEVLKSKRRAKVLRVARRSGKTYFMAGYILWKSCTNRGFRTLVVAPGERHIRLIFDCIMDNFINLDCDSARLFKSKYFVSKKERNPMEIVLNKDSVVTFVPAGSRSGNEGRSVRGQGGNLIVIDEADYLDDRDAKGIFPIFYESPSVEIFLTSTPTGMDSVFKMICNSAYDHKTEAPAKDGWDDWEHFHYTCWETKPHWDEDTDKQSREVLGAEYEHEELAEFGKEVKGVFDKEKIEICKQKEPNYYNFTDKRYPTYGYQVSDPNPRGINILTVDWDKYQSGPTIMIAKVLVNEQDNSEIDLRYFTDRVNIKVIKRIDIPIQEMSYIAATETIFELVPSFNVKHIYTDAGGGGEVEIELMQKHFKENPGNFNIDNIHRVTFNGKYKYKDTITGEDVTTTTKQLMVTLTKRKILSETIILNPNDSELINQLRNYRVVRIKPSGVPEYSSVREHSVDTLMMAVLGAYEQFTNLIHGPAASPEDSKLMEYPYLSNKKKTTLLDKLGLEPIPQPYNDEYDPDRPIMVARKNLTTKSPIFGRRLKNPTFTRHKRRPLSGR